MGGGRIHISGCIQIQNVEDQAGYFVHLASDAVAVIDACIAVDTFATAGVIANENTGDKVYLRGNDFRNTSYLANFTGVVAELVIPNGIVSALPTANAKYKGLRTLVTDATATTFMSTVAGGGANIVPVVCDGAAWKIG
jgi:hypothetical protein